MANLIDCLPRTVRRIIHEDLELYSKCKQVVQKLEERHVANQKKNARKLARNEIKSDRFEFIITIDEAWLYLSDWRKNNDIGHLRRGES